MFFGLRNVTTFVGVVADGCADNFFLQSGDLTLEFTIRSELGGLQWLTGHGVHGFVLQPLLDGSPFKNLLSEADSDVDCECACKGE